MEAVDPVTSVEGINLDVRRYVTKTGSYCILSAGVTHGRLSVWYESHVADSLDEAGHLAEAYLWAWCSTGLVGVQSFHASHPARMMPEAP